MKNKQTNTITARYAALLFTVLALCRPENTAALTEGDFTYSFIDGGQTVRIDGYTTGSVVNLIIPDTLGGKPVKTIGFGAFNSKTTLQSINFPDSLASIETSAFFGCTGLQSVSFPNSLIHIGGSVFYRCSALTQLTLPDSLIEIGLEAFRECTGLTQAAIPASVTQMDGYPFIGCTGLTQISVHSNSLHFSDRDGVLFNKEQTVLYQYPGAKSGPYTLPGSVEKILERAFASCGEFTEVTIPASVAVIEFQAFQSCAKLQKARFEGHAPKANSGLFSGIFGSNADDFKVQFYEGAREFSTPVWRRSPSESLPITSLSIWRTLFGLAADELTAANGEPLLIAYALKLDPEDSAARLPVPLMEGGTFRLDFPADRSDVLLKVERSTDLLSGVWETAGVETNSGTGSFSVPLSGADSPDKLYLRFTAARQAK